MSLVVRIDRCRLGCGICTVTGGGVGQLAQLIGVGVGKWSDTIVAHSYLAGYRTMASPICEDYHHKKLVSCYIELVDVLMHHKKTYKLRLIGGRVALDIS